MANKGLKGNYPVPDSILRQLEKDIKSHEGKNRRRVINYVNKGYLTDREIAKLIYDDKYNNLGDEKDSKILDRLIKWCKKEIEGKTKHIDRVKRSQMNIGLENKFKKSHHKWNDDTKPISSDALRSIPKSTVDMFENVRITKKQLLESINMSTETPESWLINLFNELEPEENDDNIKFYDDYQWALDYDKKDKELYISYYRIWNILKNNFKLTGEQVRDLVKNAVENIYKLTVNKTEICY
jgi:hypothetical protein